MDEVIKKIKDLIKEVKDIDHKADRRQKEQANLHYEYWEAWDIAIDSKINTLKSILSLVECYKVDENAETLEDKLRDEHRPAKTKDWIEKAEKEHISHNHSGNTGIYDCFACNGDEILEKERLEGKKLLETMAEKFRPRKDNNGKR